MEYGEKQELMRSEVCRLLKEYYDSDTDWSEMAADVHLDSRLDLLAQVNVFAQVFKEVEKDVVCHHMLDDDGKVECVEWYGVNMDDVQIPLELAHCDVKFNANAPNPELLTEVELKKLLALRIVNGNDIEKTEFENDIMMRADDFDKVLGIDDGLETMEDLMDLLDKETPEVLERYILLTPGSSLDCGHLYFDFDWVNYRRDKAENEGR